MSEYNFKEIEKKWKEKWEAEKLYKTDINSDKKKSYLLVEFPFPSGTGLHVGHVRSYTAMDIIARKRRAEGFEVMFPIGYDAFGLPAENFAIKMGVHPSIITQENINNFRKQLKSCGFSFDFDREVDTTDPSYYKWTQWIFLKMYENGLAYKKNMPVNWCPKDRCVLANEEVIEGKCERCGTITEKKDKEQWMLAITKYAERLDKDLDDTDFLEKIKIQQRNWIGISEGSEIDWTIKNFSDEYKFTVFTTRADTIFGCTYCVLAPEHKLVEKLLHDGIIKNREEVENYIKEAKQKTDIDRGSEGKEKSGIRLDWINAINPANGEEVPVYIADYVLPNYGTGAIMAVPAHDARDFEFANKFNIPIKEVVARYYFDKEYPTKEKQEEKFYKAVNCIVRDLKNKKVLTLSWEGYDWHTFITGKLEKDENDLIEAAKREIREETGYTNLNFIKTGNVYYSRYYQPSKNENRFSEVRYVEFELVDDKQDNIEQEELNKHKPLWVDEKDILNVVSQQYDKDYWSGNFNKINTDSGVLINSGEFNGLTSSEARVKVTEKLGGKIVKKSKLRDWVFARQRYWGEPIPIVFDDKGVMYPVHASQLPIVLPNVEKYEPTDTGKSPLSVVKDWVEVKGVIDENGYFHKDDNENAKIFFRETDTMPQWAGSSWYFLRYLDVHNDEKICEESIMKKWMPVDWYNGGMEHTTLHLLYSRFWYKFLFDIGIVPTSEPYKKRTSQGMILGEGMVKMSKSLGNVVNPDDIINEYGADTLRIFEMFISPFDQAVAWDSKAINGVARFLERVYKLSDKFFDAEINTKKNSLSDKNKKIEKSVENGYIQNQIISIANKINIWTKVDDSVQEEVSSIVKDIYEKKEESETNNNEILLNQTIKKVSEDIEEMKFNTAISQMMILLNDFEKLDKISKKDFERFILLLAPFAPFMTEELWEKIGNKESIHLSSWPSFDESKLINNKVTFAIQINGKLRGKKEMKIDSTQEEVLEDIKTGDFYVRNVEGKEIKKVIFVKNKLINIVV